MPSAWQHREYKQQEFIRQLVREVHDLADKTPDYEVFMLDFAIALLNYYCIRINGIRDLERSDVGLVLQKFANKIASFIRVSSESDYLLYLLFKELEISIFARGKRDYLRDQITNPEAVFGAPSTMTDVGFE